MASEAVGSLRGVPASDMVTAEVEGRVVWVLRIKPAVSTEASVIAPGNSKPGIIILGKRFGKGFTRCWWCKSCSA